MSTKASLANEMRNFAATRVAEAQTLIEMSKELDGMDEDQFKQHLGAEYGGAAWVAQMMEQVEAAAHARSGQQWALNKAFAEVLAASQRADAQKES